MPGPARVGFRAAGAPDKGRPSLILCDLRNKRKRPLGHKFPAVGAPLNEPKGHKYVPLGLEDRKFIPPPGLPVIAAHTPRLLPFGKKGSTCRLAPSSRSSVTRVTLDASHEQAVYKYYVHAFCLVSLYQRAIDG
jgi:hypothetical protein